MPGSGLLAVHRQALGTMEMPGEGLVWERGVSDGHPLLSMSPGGLEIQMGKGLVAADLPCASEGDLGI